VRSDKDVLPMLQKHHLDTDSGTIPQLKTSYPPPLFCPQFLARELPFSDSTYHTHTHTHTHLRHSGARKFGKETNVTLSLSRKRQRGLGLGFSDPN
jgi:hypothetical protein